MVIRVEEPKYTEQELCETVFYLSRYAECLEIDKTITVPDERELFWMLYDWAIDHHEKLETEGARWLMETFPYTPELDEDFDAGPETAPVFGM